ncbi:hypothetical protein [Rhizobium sp. CCGE 510]|uniref:hypothetical protein n=1 Tax=Rhizobium sp. CCGE 510 TaxID=1132836 RepID=UPI00027B8EA0|nr:hypothetical protein [Rhizobium sp. CCGE 510]EJT02102.1 hypothetical protein RCCGE510_26406 [Rhizobium sp. CCGE 510]
MLNRSKWLRVLGLTVAALTTPVTSFAGAQSASADLPDWLKAYVGVASGQIAPVVLERARALYFDKRASGEVHNSCYFAMDATRPNDLSDGQSGGRFYVICEATRTFRVMSAGHGSGLNLPGVANFANGRECARNFGNAQDSNLTTGGSYLTSEIKWSFKGYYRTSGKQLALLTRSFVQFDGVGDTANARERAIGGHAAAKLSQICMLKKPDSPYADSNGYVPLGKLVTYAGGRSNGCTSWSPSEASQVISAISDNPTSLYIYPESRDVNAVSKALASGQSPADKGLYWNSACLAKISSPKYWSKKTLEPLIAQYKADHPAPPSHPAPICATPTN